MKISSLSFLLIFVFLACGEDEESEPMVVLPEVSISASQVFEINGDNTINFQVNRTGDITEAITINYTVEGITATPGEDFVADQGSVVIDAGANNTNIAVTILEDDINEVDEKLRVVLTGATNATIKGANGVGLIKDDDDPANFEADGYVTRDEFFGYELKWEDDCSGPELDLSNYNYELDDGCPNLCGWGNMELQWYTDLPDNLFFEDGKMILRATQEGPTSFKSARIQTKGKKEFQFGRIDVRAKLPRGQGIWPAIWMLGQNIDDVSWPACGEIDIMEMVGHEPNRVHGTAHWGEQGQAGSVHKGSAYTLTGGEEFIDQFHVFSIVWEMDEIVWYVDEEKYFSIDPTQMQGQEYRFNQPFFFIFNVAVGGQWPGNPDETTTFPQQMEIDYIRVFQ